MIIPGWTGSYSFGKFLTSGSWTSRIGSYTQCFTVFVSALTAKTSYWSNCWNSSSYFSGHICITYYRTEAEIFLQLSPRAVGYTDKDGGAYFVLRWRGGTNKQAPETLTCRGFWGNSPPENLKSWSSKMLLSALSTTYQKNKRRSTVKWQMLYFLFVTSSIYNLKHISQPYVYFDCVH